MIYKEDAVICVDDLSKEFNKSKATIYKKLKSNKELIKPIIRKDRKTYISAEAVQWLQSVYSKNSNTLEKDVQNNLQYKNIEEENKIKKDEFIVNNTENNINVSKSIDNNEERNKSTVDLKEETKKMPIENQFVEENNNNVENLESMNSNKDSLIVTSEETNDNIVTTEEAIRTTNFAHEERVQLSLDNEVFGLLKSYVKFLETECTTKNKQLDSKDDIIKNMQVLLENEQDIVSSQVNLEDRCREMDDKLFQLKGQLENRQKKHKKGFLKKFFKL